MREGAQDGEGNGDRSGNGDMSGNGNENGEGVEVGAKRALESPHQRRSRLEDQTLPFRTRHHLYRHEAALI